MAFSATDWAYRLSEWSGSAQGAKSWSALGTSTRIGEYFTALQKASFYSTAIDATYLGHGAGGTTNARNPDPFYVSAYRYDYTYTSYYNAFYEFFSPRFLLFILHNPPTMQHLIITNPKEFTQL